MKLHRLFLIAALTGTFAVIGCGDSGGGQSASQVCDGCDVPDLRANCEAAYDRCRTVDRGTEEECIPFALAMCGGEV